ITLRQGALLIKATGLLQGPAPIIHALRSLWALSAVLDDSRSLPQGDIRARPSFAGCLIYGFGHSRVINVSDVLDDAVAIRIPAVDAIGEGSFRQCRSRLRPVGQGSNSTHLPFSLPESALGPEASFFGQRFGVGLCAGLARDDPEAVMLDFVQPQPARRQRCGLVKVRSGARCSAGCWPG